MPSTFSNEAVEIIREYEINSKHFSPIYDLLQENVPNVELMDEYEVEPTANNTYMPWSKISFLTISNIASTNDAYQCINNIMSNEVVSDSDSFIVNKVFALKEELQARLYKFTLQNHFQFKTVKYGKNKLIVTCEDNNCYWSIHATKIKNSS